MHIPRQQLLLGILLALVLGIVVFAFATQTAAPTPGTEPAPTQQTPVEQSGNENEAPAEEQRTAIVRGSDETATRLAATDVAATATLIVDGARFPLTATDGSTLKEAMDQLQSEGGFAYTSRNYAGLGAFVTHIQGRAGTGENVWILYVNGEQSNTGISSTRIRSGDVIEWKLEKSY